MIARNRHAGTNGGNGGSAASEPPRRMPNPSPPSSPPVSDGSPAGFPGDALTRGLAFIGLTSHEAQMYHTLLRHGPSTARAAIQQSRLDRATGYRILSRLRARGLVTAAGYRPQKFVALDAGRLLDRVSTILRDELDLHRIVREVYLASLPAARENLAAGVNHVVHAGPEPVRAPMSAGLGRYRLLPGNEPVGRYILEGVAEAKEEVGALLRPQTVPEPLREDISNAFVRAIQRGVRLKVVLDYHPADLEFLTGILRQFHEPSAALEVRFYAPQLARLFVIDRRYAMRCVGAPGCPHHGPDLGIASEDAEFVRVQHARFQTTWRESVPLENALRSPQGSLLAPPSASVELRQWVERNGRVDQRGFATDSYGFMPDRVFRR